MTQVYKNLVIVILFGLAINSWGAPSNCEPDLKDDLAQNLSFKLLVQDKLFAGPGYAGDVGAKYKYEITAGGFTEFTSQLVGSVDIYIYYYDESGQLMDATHFQGFANITINHNTTIKLQNFQQIQTTYGRYAKIVKAAELVGIFKTQKDNCKVQLISDSRL